MRNIRRLSVAFILILLTITGYSRFAPPVQAQAPGPDAVEDANTEFSLIVKALPSYRDDGLALFEQAEITTVEEDIAMIRQDEQGVNGGPLLVNEVKLLKSDWESLVALDDILQRESLI